MWWVVVPGFACRFGIDAEPPTPSEKSAGESQGTQSNTDAQSRNNTLLATEERHLDRLHQTILILRAEIYKHFHSYFYRYTHECSDHY